MKENESGKWEGWTQWRLKHKARESLILTLSPSKQTFTLLGGLCPLSHSLPLGFFLHPTPRPLLFPFPVPFQHLPPTSTNSVASCRNMANVTELWETEPQLPCCVKCGSGEDQKTRYGGKHFEECLVLSKCSTNHLNVCHSHSQH